MKRIIFIAAAIVVAAGTGGALMWQNSAAASAYNPVTKTETLVNTQSTVRPYNCGTSGCTQDDPHSHSSDGVYVHKNTGQYEHRKHGHGGNHH